MRIGIILTLSVVLLLLAHSSSASSAPPTVISLGGHFHWDASGTCLGGHPNTDCTCPTGFVPDLGTSSGDGTFVVLCYGTITAESAFQGVFSVDVASGDCTTPNLATNDCSCPSTSVGKITLPGKAPAVTICIGAKRDVGFSGAYGPATANPLLNNSYSCPQISRTFPFGGQGVVACGIDCAAADGVGAVCTAVGACSWCPTKPMGRCLFALTSPPLAPECCSAANTTGAWCEATLNTGQYYYSVCCETDGSCCHWEAQEYFEAASCCPPGSSCCGSESGEGVMGCCLNNQTCSNGGQCL